jgi:KDO2-lipid IV(A) lauroyltransferase
MARRKKHHIASPYLWPSWLGLFLLWFCGRFLSYPVVLGMGRKLGRLIYLLGRRRRRIAETNLRICFPEKNDAEREQLLRDHFESLGIGLLLTGFAWWASEDKLRPLVKVEGLEHLEAGVKQGRGVIVLGSHFTDLELSGRLFVLFHPVAVMYRQHENPVIERAYSRNKQRNFTAVIPRDDIRQTLRILKKNQPIWYAVDQSFKGPNSILAPFFNEPASTNTATSRLAKVSKAPVLMYSCYRLPGREGFRLVFSPPLADFPTDDPEADATRINAMVEDAIRIAPEQYLWIHRRFKKRKVLPDPY